MKKLIALSMLSALLLTACAPEGEDLQGRFGSTTTNTVTMTLDGSSPTGSRTVSADDSMMEFNMKSNLKQVLSAGSEFRVDFSTDVDLDTTTAPGTSVYLFVNGDIVGTGTFSIIDKTNPSEGVAFVTLSSAVTINAKATKFTVRTDSNDILAEDSGVDDEVVVSVEYNGKTVTGNTVNY